MTALEKIIYQLALKEAGERNDVAQFIGGTVPGWFFARPFTLESTMGLSGSDIHDAYLYSPEVAKEKMYSSLSHLQEDVPSETDTFTIAYRLFYSGAFTVTLRPADVLIEDKTPGLVSFNLVEDKKE